MILYFFITFVEWAM